MTAARSPPEPPPSGALPRPMKKPPTATAMTSRRPRRRPEPVCVGEWTSLPQKKIGVLCRFVVRLALGIAHGNHVSALKSLCQLMSRCQLPFWPFLRVCATSRGVRRRWGRGRDHRRRRAGRTPGPGPGGGAQIVRARGVDRAALRVAVAGRAVASDVGEATSRSPMLLRGSSSNRHTGPWVAMSEKSARPF